MAENISTTGSYQLLHSGKFNNAIDSGSTHVLFTKNVKYINMAFVEGHTYNIDTEIEYLYFPYYGGTQQFVIWSREGNVKIYTDSIDSDYYPTEDWVSLTTVSATKIPNSEYYSYVYEITVPYNNEKTTRYTYLYVRIDGDDSIEKKIRIEQHDQDYAYIYSRYHDPGNDDNYDMTVKPGGGTFTWKVGSDDGHAELFDPAGDWVTWKQISGIKRLGTMFFDYTFEINVSPNTTGETRTIVLTVGIEGIPTSVAKKTITITQKSIHWSDIKMNPETLTFDRLGGTQRVKVWSSEGNAQLLNITDSTSEWLSWKQVSATQQNNGYYIYEYDITCAENNTTSVEDRTSSITVGLEGISTSVANRTISITQDGMAVYPDDIIVDQESYYLDDTAGTFTFTCSCRKEQAYLMSVLDSGWLKIESKAESVIEGTHYNKYTYVLSYTKNTEQDERQFDMTIKINNVDLSVASKTVSVRQKAHVITGKDIEVSENDVTIGATGYFSPYLYKILYANSEYSDITVSAANDDWLDISSEQTTKIEGTNYYQHKITLNATESYTTSTRTTVFYLNASNANGVATIPITVTQNGQVATDFVHSIPDSAYASYNDTLLYVTVVMNYKHPWVINSSIPEWLTYVSRIETQTDEPVNDIVSDTRTEYKFKFKCESNYTGKAKTGTLLFQISDINGSIRGIEIPVAVTQEGTFTANEWVISNSPLLFPKEGGEQQAIIDKVDLDGNIPRNTNVLVTSDPEWVSVSNTVSASRVEYDKDVFGYRVKYDITTTENTGNQRSKDIQFGNSPNIKIITVVQQGNVLHDISVNNNKKYPVLSGGDEWNFTVCATSDNADGLDINLVNNLEWATVENTDVDVVVPVVSADETTGNGVYAKIYTYHVTVSENTTGEDRQGNIDISLVDYPDNKVTIKLEQYN